MKKQMQKRWCGFIAIMIIAIQTLVTAAPVFAITANDVTADLSNKRETFVTLNGKQEKFYMAPIYLDRGNGQELVFCVDIEHPVINGGGYSSNPFELNRKANLISSLWKYVGTDWDTYFVAQEMMYEEIGVHLDSIEGLSLEQRNTIKGKINQVIDEYEKKPSFHEQTVKLILGQSMTLTDQNQSQLSTFNLLDSNTADIDYSINGSDLIITPKKTSNEKGSLTLSKNMEIGTPYIWKKPDSQDVVTGGINVPNSFTIHFEIEKMGKLQIKKLDAETGKPMKNVEFKGKIGDDLIDVKTNDQGLATIEKEYLHGTSYDFEEVTTQNGYVLNSTHLTGKIVAGEVITVSMNNDIQKGRIKGKKVQEFYNRTLSEKEGKSIFGKRPLAGVVIDVVNVSDIIRPDGSIVSKAGDVSDTFTTGKDGEFVSTKDLYIGTQNKYKLVERDVPENYRPLYDEQAEFSIAYDKENKLKLFTFDLGTVDNDLKTGGFNLEKIDSETGKIIPNTEFLLRGLSESNKDVLYTIVTGDKATIEKLVVGRYEIIETKFADGWGQSQGEPQTKVFEIKDNETTKLVVKNDKIIVLPKVTIKTKAHIGDGKTNTFTWGEDVTFYDDVEINHEDILDGTTRAFETIQVAVYPNKTEKEVWSSGKIDYKVSDQALTRRIQSEYDYKNDPVGTGYYFKEIGYSKPSEKEYISDTEHNKDGSEKSQDIFPIVKEEPKSEIPKETPKEKEVLPHTGETQMKELAIAGTLLLILTSSFIYLKFKKSKEDSDKGTPSETNK